MVFITINVVKSEIFIYLCMFFMCRKWRHEILLLLLRLGVYSFLLSIWLAISQLVSLSSRTSVCLVMSHQLLWFLVQVMHRILIICQFPINFSLHICLLRLFCNICCGLPTPNYGVGVGWERLTALNVVVCYY